jgi:hypothetical protein
MEELARDAQFSYWKARDGYVYRASTNSRAKFQPGIICRVDQWEKIKVKLVKP